MYLKVSIKKKFEHFMLDADFEVREDIFALLGASGCGKSMTLKCIAGIEQPDEGLIILNDKVLFDSARHINLPPQKRKVGYMFQDFALFPTMTVRKNIAVGMGKHADEKKVDSFVRRFQLTGLEHHYPRELSGGQKQRVAMARMLASEPEAILLDEPFSALDSYLKWKLEQEMKDLLLDVKKSVIFVSHDRDEVYHMCDTVACMNEGHLEVIEPVKEFFRNPKTKTAAILSGCKNISKVEFIDEHTLWANDWNIRLRLDRTLKPEISYAAIRAHNFRQSPTSEQDLVFPVKKYRAIEDPFEWTMSFETGVEEKRTTENQSLQWKMSKNIWNFQIDKMPETLYVKPEDILLLE